MGKVYIELICDEDIADELFTYGPKRVDFIRYDDNQNTIIEMGGEKYRKGDEE